MNKYVEQLLNDEKYVSNSRELNFGIKENLTPELYEEEILKFSRYFFYQTRLNDNLARVDNINDMLLYYNENMLEYIKALYDYAVISNDIESISAISYIIYSIYKSFALEPYKSNKGLRDYQIQFKEYFPHRLFSKGNIIINEGIEFAKQLLEEISEDFPIFFDRISVECFHILYYNYIDTSEYFKKFLSRDNLYFLDEIIRYDVNLAANYRIYFNYQINCLIDDDKLIILIHLCKEKLITQIDEKEIISEIKKQINAYEKCDDYFTKLNRFENIIRTLNNVIRIQTLSDETKNKLIYLRKRSYSIKRSVVINVKDEDFPLHEFKFNIDQSKFENFKSAFKLNPFEAIAQHCIINFENSINSCVETRTKYILHQIADVITTDEEGLVFRKNKKEIKSEYSQYYNDLFIKFFENHKERISNRHIFTNSNGYNHLMSYMTDIFNVQISLIGAWIKAASNAESYETSLYNKLNSLPTYNNNYYIMFLEMIIQIEAHLNKIYNFLLDSNNSNFSEEVLESIFCQFKKSKYSNLLLNGIMYINFILYDKLGLQYRNKLAHGKFRSGIKDDKVFLGILTSWIIASAISGDLENEH